MTAQTTPSGPSLDDEDDGSDYFRGLDRHDAQAPAETPETTTDEKPADTEDTLNHDHPGCTCVICRIRDKMEASEEIPARAPADLVFQRKPEQGNKVKISVCDDDAEVIATMVTTTDFLKTLIHQGDIIVGIPLRGEAPDAVKVEVTPDELKTVIGRLFKNALDSLDAENNAAPEPGDDPTDPQKPVM